MVTYLWITSDQLIKRPLPEFTKYFNKYPSKIYLESSYKEQWEPFIKISEGDNLIVRIGSPGLSNNLLNRIKKSKFNQKILLLGEVPWRRKIKRIYNDISAYLKFFDKIYTYIKPLTNNKNVFYLGNNTGIPIYKESGFSLDMIDFDKKINKISIILSEHSRWDVLNANNVISALKNPKKFGSIINQLIGHPNATFKVNQLKYNKLYGVRSQITRYLDKSDIIDIFGRSGWRRTKNYKGEIINYWDTSLKYRWSLCIENNNINNYYSEKPFNALLTGCVPIVLGGPNPNDILPKGCFVDLRKISYKDLPDYINDEENYYQHLGIIKNKYNFILKHIHTHYKYLRIINTNEDLTYKE